MKTDDMTIVASPEIEMQSPLKAKLVAWQVNPEGKCGSCLYALAFNNRLNKYGGDTDCVDCSCLAKAVSVDHNNFSRANQDAVIKQGWFNLYRIEVLGRFSCPCWESK